MPLPRAAGPSAVINSAVSVSLRSSVRAGASALPPRPVPPRPHRPATELPHPGPGPGRGPPRPVPPGRWPAAAPPDVPAAHRGGSSSSPRPSRWTGDPGDGVCRRRHQTTCRQRDRSVIAMSSGSTDGAHSRNTVRGGGSSTTFSNALCTLGRPVGVLDDDDLPAARAGTARRGGHDGAHLVDSRSTIPRHDPTDVGCVPAIVVVQARHRPHPGSPSPVHCRAAAEH